MFGGVDAEGFENGHVGQGVPIRRGTTEAILRGGLLGRPVRASLLRSTGTKHDGNIWSVHWH